MTFDELQEDIQTELDWMATVVQEIVDLRQDTINIEPTNREKTAASAYLAQFYNGVENILKRFSRFFNMPLPTSSNWHIDLFNRFCSPPEEPLPPLFDDTLITDMTGLRKFRHVVHHGYGFQLDWERLVGGMNRIEDIFEQFKSVVLTELSRIDTSVDDANNKCT
jgi:hypothetical protein